MDFQLTTSQGGRRSDVFSVSVPLFFQLTTSQGGRPERHVCGRSFTVFQLTTSQGGRPFRRFFMSSRQSFNSRPHKEVDNHCIDSDAGIWSFNSRPHKEVDIKRYRRKRSLDAFQLTTSQGGRLFLQIHPENILCPFNSRPHKEVDMIRSTCIRCITAFQLTTSQGGRP